MREKTFDKLRKSLRVRRWSKMYGFLIRNYAEILSNEQIDKIFEEMKKIYREGLRDGKNQNK